MHKLNKILVIGASVAGPAVCYWLKRYGFSPTLIERQDSLRKGGYAVDIRGIAVSTVKKMGIYDEICKQRSQIQFGRYVDTEGNTLSEEQGEAFGFRQGDDVEIVRGDLVEILMKLIPDVPCFFNTVVTQIKQHIDGVEVSFNNGLVELYDLVIGADGLHSSTRAKVFAPDEYSMLSLGAYISVFSVPNYLKLNHSEIYFEANQKLVNISSDKNPQTAQAGFMFRSAHVMKDISDEREQRKLLKDTFYNLGWESNKILALLEQSNDLYFDSITQVKMNSWTKARVALVGDAGYCASPLSGQGTSLALVGAYLLAGELNAANSNYNIAFKRYNQLLRPMVEANQEFGVWASETFLLEGKLSPDAVEERANNILEKLQAASNAIDLPIY